MFKLNFKNQKYAIQIREKKKQIKNFFILFYLHRRYTY